MSVLTYDDRIKALREKKIAHTREKIKNNGFMNGDDYGTIPLPVDFKFTPYSNHTNDGFYGNEGWSKNFALLLEVHPVYVDRLEIMCGRWSAMLPEYRKPWPEDLYPYEFLKQDQEKYGITSGIGADAHFACDYNIGIELGWNGILDKIRKYRDINTDRKEFYDAEELVVVSIQKFIKKHIEELKRLIDAEKSEEVKITLEKMLKANEWVVDNPPRTFLEACQWISWFSVVSRIYDRDGAGCQLDVMLLPFYEKDISMGLLDDEEAVFILANLFLIETHYHQLAGADKDDNDLTNKVSWLALEAAHKLNTSINLTVRVHNNIDNEFLHKAVEYLFTDRNGWPRFSGDKGLLGYMKKGHTKSEARDRIAVGCNWMALPGREYTLNDCVKINTARVFDLSFHEMMANGDASTHVLWELFSNHLKKAVEVTAEGINFHLEHQYKVMPELVMNLMMRNTLETGKDITQCSEKFNLGIDGAGLGTVADSFAALEQRIEIEKVATWDEVYEAIKNDFENAGGERIRKMLQSSQRYCQGNSLGDKWAEKISDMLTTAINNQEMPDHRNLIPGWFSWSDTIRMGQQVGATPNGRKAYTPITHGANPTPGFRKDGAPTAMALGIANIQPGYGNPAPIQLEMDPRLSVEEGGVDRVVQLVKGHVEKGGTLMNINILDKETIMEANENPELYPDLVVRVTGFTAYFAALSPDFRKLVVDRFIEGL